MKTSIESKPWGTFEGREVRLWRLVNANGVELHFSDYGGRLVKAIVPDRNGKIGNVVLGWVVTALFLIREIGITVMRFFVIDTGGKVIAASQAGKYKTLCQCVGLAMLMLPMWSLADGMNATPLWMTIYYTITYALIYLALILCLYSGGEYLVNTFGGRKKAAKEAR